MIRALTFLCGLLATTAGQAGTVYEAPPEGVRASYTLSFGGGRSMPLHHALAMSTGSAQHDSRMNAFEWRWSEAGQQVWLAGRPYAWKHVNANNDNSDGGWFLEDPQTLALILLGGAALAVVVDNIRDSNADSDGIPSGTGSSN
jgi:hypothetical protein